MFPLSSKICNYDIIWSNLVSTRTNSKIPFKKQNNEEA